MPTIMLNFLPLLLLFGLLFWSVKSMPTIMLNFLPLLLLFGLLFWDDYQKLKQMPEQACLRWHAMQQRGFAVFLFRQVGMLALVSLIVINLVLWLLYRKQPAEWSFFPSDSLAFVLTLGMIALLMLRAVALWLMYGRMCRDRLEVFGLSESAIARTVQDEMHKT